MELIDIVDENNKLTGQVEERKMVHEKCLWHRHVSSWIMNKNGEILLQRRSANKARNPNKWAKTGGHVDSGESVEDAICREVKEEIGIDIPKEQIEILEIFKSKDPNNKYFAYHFLFVVDYKIEDYTLQKEEVTEVKYITIEEMELIKKSNDSNYTFCKWNDEDFYREIEILKQKRKSIRQKDIIEKVINQLEIDLNCKKEDFNSEGIIYTEARENEKQRKCIRKKPYVELVTMGQACVITIDNKIKEIVKKELDGKTRNEISELNILTEAEIHYIPDMDRMIQKRTLLDEFTYEIIEGNKEVEKLYELPEFSGFDNSIQYGENYVGPDEIVLYAKHNDEVVAMAGASKDTEDIWQIGVDVKKNYRNRGLATALVSNLANIIIEKGKIPYYSTTSSNIPSQLVAYKCGFMPFWYSKKTINQEYLK